MYGANGETSDHDLITEFYDCDMLSPVACSLQVKWIPSAVPPQKGTVTTTRLHLIKYQCFDHRCKPQNYLITAMHKNNQAWLKQPT